MRTTSAALDIFSVRDLRQRSGQLLRDAAAGKMALITKHGRPAILALPFDELLLAHGVHRALAVRLFEAGHATLAQAAKIADLTLEDFLDLLRETGIPAVDYPSSELDEELESAR